MKLECTGDMDAVKAFMMNPEILERASEDGANPNPEFTCGHREAWLLATKNGEVIGAVNVHLLNGVMAEFHPYVLSKHAKQGTNMVRLFLLWFKANMPEEITKLIAYIPTYVPGVFRAAIKLGFTHEGTNRACFRKNGIIYDMNLVGITRGEINGKNS